MARLGRGRRRRGERDGGSGAGASRDDGTPGGPDAQEGLATWEFARVDDRPSSPGDPDVIDLTTSGQLTSDGPSSADRAAQYSAWAERMRAKRQRNKERIAEANGHHADRSEPSYWKSDAVFADDDGAAHGRTGLGPGEVAALYSQLELAPGADLPTVADAYRRLAKRHHPDRWATADAATRSHHEDQMLAVNRAYRLLRAELDRDDTVHP